MNRCLKVVHTCIYILSAFNKLNQKITTDLWKKNRVINFEKNSWNSLIRENSRYKSSGLKERQLSRILRSIVRKREREREKNSTAYFYSSERSTKAEKMVGTLHTRRARRKRFFVQTEACQPRYNFHSQQMIRGKKSLGSADKEIKKLCWVIWESKKKNGRRSSREARVNGAWRLPHRRLRR